MLTAIARIEAHIATLVALVEATPCPEGEAMLAGLRLALAEIQAADGAERAARREASLC